MVNVQAALYGPTTAGASYSESVRSLSMFCVREADVGRSHRVPKACRYWLSSAASVSSTLRICVVCGNLTQTKRQRC